MEAPSDCIQHLQDEIAAFKRRIRTLQKLPKDGFPKSLISYYEGLIRVNIEVIAILENQNNVK
jgi:hypothetical protein